MKLPISSTTNRLSTQSVQRIANRGIQPQELRCSTGPCRNGKRLHACFKRVCTYIPGSPGSPDLGIPGSPGHLKCDWVMTHSHWHGC